MHDRAVRSGTLQSRSTHGKRPIQATTCNGIATIPMITMKIPDETRRDERTSSAHTVRRCHRLSTTIDFATIRTSPWWVVVLPLNVIKEHTFHTVLDLFDTLEQPRSLLWRRASCGWRRRTASPLHNCTARCDEGHVALLVRAVLAGVEHRKAHEVALVRKTIGRLCSRGRWESRYKTGMCLVPRLVCGGATGTENASTSSSCSDITSPTWSLATSWSSHEMIHGTRGVGRPGGACRHGRERVVPLVVLLDHLSPKYLPNLAAAAVGVPAARVHVKESIERQLIKLLDNMLFRMGRRITRQY
jgi:hypothetical protein